jgi:hypothetical protein
VHSLGREQLITVEAARTNGDYLRELAPKPDLQSAVRRAFRAVERVQFGRGQATAELCSELWACVLPIVRRSAALLVLLLLPLALGACSQIRRPASDFGPSGNHLFTKLMQDGGTRVRKLIRAQVDEDVSQLLVLGREASPEAWQMALSFAVDGGSVVVTEPSQGLLRELYVEIERGAPCARSLEVPQAQGSTALSVVGPGQRYLRIAPDTEREGSARPRVDASCAGKAYVATFAYGDGYLTLLANRELLENLSLSVADNAAFTLGLFGPPGGTLGVVGLWTGGGVDSPLSALKNAGLGPVLLALLALLFALLWHLGAAFGTRRDPSDPARRAFADHVRALGRNYARAGARRQALAQYAAYALEVLRERFGRGAPLGLIALSGEVARRSGRAESDVMQLLVEAHEVAQSQDAERGVASDLKTIEQLEILLYPSGGTK